MSQPNLRVAIYPFEPRLEIRAQMLLAIEEIGMPETSMISPAGPSFAACDQLRRAHRRTCSSADPSRTGSAWRMESIGRKRPSRHSSSCQRMQMFLFCSYQGFAGALPSLLLREAVTGPAGLGGMASPALLDQHQTAGLARLGCGPRVLRKGSKRIYSPAGCTACLPPPGSRAFPRRSRDGSCAKPFVSCGDACACATRLRLPP